MITMKTIRAFLLRGPRLTYRTNLKVDRISRWRRCALFTATWLMYASAQSAVIPVTTTADVADGSLRKAVASAAPGDTIVFQIPLADPGYNPATGSFVVTLSGKTAGELDIIINKNLTIDGSAQKIVVHRAPDAPATFRIFTIGAGANVTLIRLWISNGNVTAALSSEGIAGGGIYNSGNLTIGDCIFTGNASKYGGAIYNLGTGLSISGTTFSGNSTTIGGGAIANRGSGPAVIDRCTFNGNAAKEGGALLRYYGTLTIRSSTIIGNTATSVVGGVFASAVSPDAMHLQNNIIAGNNAPSDSDVRGAVTSEGHNLIGSPQGHSGFNPDLGDQIGVTTADLKLQPLGYYGGGTPTMLPSSGSIAIDRGVRTADSNGALISSDQRGLPRPVDRPEANVAGSDGSDVGAVELGLPQTGPTFTVTTTELRGSECTVDECTLNVALNLANSVADANTINFAPGVTGTIQNLNSTGLSVSKPVTINGPGSRKLSISANNTGRIFNVSGTNVTISGLTISAGREANANGGAILNTGSLTINDCRFEACSSGTGSGGAIYSGGGTTLTLNRCLLDINYAGEYGGAIYNEGVFTATNCTFTRNLAILRGGALISRANPTANSTLRNCTITDNTAFSDTAGKGDGGGGYFAEGSVQQHHVGNCIIAGNHNSVNPDVRGNFTSDGHNFIGNVANAVGFSNNEKGDQVGTPGNVKNARLGTVSNYGGSIDTLALLSDSPARDKGDDNLAPPTDARDYGRNGISDIGAFEFAGLLPVTLANISTRLRVEAGDNVLIGGFIVTGFRSNKKVMIRAIGPSLSQFFSGTLPDPTLELRDGTGALIESNDNWISSPNKQAIVDSGIAPSNDFESAIIATLPANGAGYTAIVRGANGATGIGVVEVYDLDRSVDSKLANISTRGLVQTGNDVLIAGTIVLGTQSQKVIIRAIGPSLPFANKLGNPTLELRDASGTLLEANDNWGDSPNKQAIVDTGVPPGNNLESAIVRTLSPASYTAIVRGAGGTTGIAVVEVYALQ